MVSRLEQPAGTRKNRARPLHGQRGAAVFIVVMVLTLLTAVGIFAVRSASMADVAAGYDREAAQASLVAQYATTATAAYLASTAGSTAIASMKPSLYCQSNMKLNASCYKMGSGTLEASVLAASGEDLFETSSSSLNANGRTVADFVVEFTEAANTGVPMPGGQHTIQVAVMATAQVQQAGACVNGVGTTWNAGQQATRSYISIAIQ